MPLVRDAWGLSWEDEKAEVAGQMVVGILWRLLSAHAWCLGWSDSVRTAAGASAQGASVGPASSRGSSRVVVPTYGGGSGVSTRVSWPRSSGAS